MLGGAAREKGRAFRANIKEERTQALQSVSGFQFWPHNKSANYVSALNLFPSKCKIGVMIPKLRQMYL